MSIKNVEYPFSARYSPRVMASYLADFDGFSTSGARLPNLRISLIMLRKLGETRFFFCANTAPRPSEPHSTSSVDSAKDMSDRSDSTPSSLKRPTR